MPPIAQIVSKYRILENNVLPWAPSNAEPRRAVLWFFDYSQSTFRENASLRAISGGRPFGRGLIFGRLQC